MRAVPRRASKSTQMPAVLVLLLALSGCGEDPVNWNAKDISGLMPDLSFELINTSEEPVSSSEYDGQVRLMFFGFTNCPDVCPTTLAHFNRAVSSLPEDQQDDVTILFVSVDPHRDTPGQIASYTQHFGNNIVGLTASEAVLRQLSKDYRTTFGYGKKDERGNYDVSHSSAVYVFDRDGEARLLMKSDLSTDQIREDLYHLLTESS